MSWNQRAGNGSAFATLDPPKPLKVKRTDKVSALLEEGLNAHQGGQMERALVAYQQVMGLDKENVPAMAAAALIHADRGEHQAAEFLLRRSLVIAPTCVAYNTLGTVLAGRRQFDAAVAAYRASIALDPTNFTTWPNILFTLDLHPWATPALRYAERRRFNEIHCKALTDAAPMHINDPDPDRRLRVGYVSADYSQHSAAHGFAPLIAGHHADQVEMYLYDVAQAKPNPDDQLPAWFRGLAHVWRDARGLSDESLAAQVRDDRIDILVDLSGYSAGGRVLMFARKPAPIQIGGFGYGTGTGIDAMNYLIGDDVVIPPQHEHWYHEQILRIPSFMAYEKAPPWPGIEPAPRERNGHVTYGYLGRAIKLSAQTLAAWGEILQTVPSAHLLFKGGEFDDPVMVAQITEALVAVGANPAHLEFRGGSSRPDHLAAYGDVDIALDPFPHGGGVTAVEAFLTGTPLIALLGNYLCGRTAASVMTTLGFKSAVARTPYEYVKNAVEMADVEWSIEERMALRARLVGSILLSPERYARAVEDAYREVWCHWCAGRTAS